MNLQYNFLHLILQVVFAFFMLNVLWIVVVFQFHVLQTSLNQDLFNKNGKLSSLHLAWPQAYYSQLEQRFDT